MTSSDGKKPNYSRRFFWLAIFIVVLFAGYSAGWFYFANRLKNATVEAVAALNDDSRVADCANADVRGYPFRIGVFCDSVDYEDETAQVYATAGSFRSAAQIYDPAHTVAELDPPLRISMPGLTPLWLDWDNLKASARLAAPIPARLSLEAEGFSAQTDPDDDGEPVELFSAGDAQTHLRPDGDDLDWAASFVDLAIDPGLAGNRILPDLSGSFDATLKNGVALLLDQSRNLRGQSAEIHRIDLSSGDAGVSVSGPVSIGMDGLIDATLTIGIRNPDAVAALLVKAFPEAKSRIETSFSGLVALGDQPTLPLKIVKGQATLGFLPLGTIPPVAN